MEKLKALMNLQCRRVLLTGASGALGSTIAETMAELGADLVLVDRPEAAFDTLRQNLAQYPGREDIYLNCDLEQQEDRDRLVAALLADGKGLNVLINNAAFVGTSALGGWALPFEEQTVDTWRRAMEVNLTAAFDLSKQFADLMRRSGAASIINVASIYGMHGPNWKLYEGTVMANPAGYAASKGGLIQLSRWLATTLGPAIRVNCVSPGGIFRNQPQVFVDRYAALTPLGRMATEDDFRGVFAYLASDLSQYVTGQNLAVDGGWGAW